MLFISMNPEREIAAGTAMPTPRIAESRGSPAPTKVPSMMKSTSPATRRPTASANPKSGAPPWRGHPGQHVQAVDVRAGQLIGDSSQGLGAHLLHRHVEAHHQHRDAFVLGEQLELLVQLQLTLGLIQLLLRVARLQLLALLRELLLTLFDLGERLLSGVELLLLSLQRLQRLELGLSLQELAALSCDLRTLSVQLRLLLRPRAISQSLLHLCVQLGVGGIQLRQSGFHLLALLLGLLRCDAASSHAWSTSA